MWDKITYQFPNFHPTSRCDCLFVLGLSSFVLVKEPLVIVLADCVCHCLLQVDMQHIWMDKYGLGEKDPIELAIDITEYYRSVEWDLMRVAAQKNIKYYTCCKEPYPDITFNITLRRKTLFYAINLIIPCVSINCLTVLTFYLPCDSGEKISLCISILLSLSLFQLLLMDLVPSTSLHIPLLAKYILFTNIIVALSVFISVVTLSVNHRSASTHEMPRFARVLFMRILPRLLLMQQPDVRDQREGRIGEDEEDFPEREFSDFGQIGNPYTGTKLIPPESDPEQTYGNLTISSTFIGDDSLNTNLRNLCDACAQRGYKVYPAHVQKALGGVAFIAKHLKDDDSSRRVSRWAQSTLWKKHTASLCAVSYGCISVRIRFVMCIYSYPPQLLHGHWRNHQIPRCQTTEPKRTVSFQHMPNHNKTQLSTNGVKTIYIESI